jgi:hypothetical protein
LEFSPRERSDSSCRYGFIKIECLQGLKKLGHFAQKLGNTNLITDSIKEIVPKTVPKTKRST